MSSDETSARRRLTFLDHVLGMGCWEWTPQTGELLWSDNHFRLYGLTPGEITPTPEFVIQRTHPADRARVSQNIGAMMAGEHPDSPELEYRIVGLDGTVRSLRMVVATRVDGAQRMRRLVGFVQDVTFVRGMDNQLAAHAAVTHALDHWTTLEHGAQALLSGLARALEMGFAVFWVPHGSTLSARLLWHEPSPALDCVAEATRRWNPGFGAAILGSALTSRQPVTRMQASQGGPSERRTAIDRAGLRGVVVIPAVAVDETLAVLEFLSFELVEPTEVLTRALLGIGHEIGHFLSHRRGELTAAVLTARELEVLQLAAKGWPATAIAREMYVSSATVKRHFEHAYASLGVSDRAAAVGEAMRRGLIT